MSHLLTDCLIGTLQHGELAQDTAALRTQGAHYGKGAFVLLILGLYKVQPQ